MEFRGQDDDMGMPTSLGYNNPPPIRGSAFSKPSPSLTSSSLHCPRGGAGGGGGGGGGTRNGNLIGNPTPPPLNPNPTIVDSNPSHNLGNNPIPAPIPISSPPTGITAATPNPKSATATNDSQVSSVATAADAASSRYRECLRNHAAAMGGHVVDGCGEFMPAGSAGTPGALKCAACGCHRSFHRREFDGVVGDTTSSAYYRSSPRFPLLLPPPHPLQPHQHQKQYSIGFPSTPSPAAVAAGSSAAAAAFGGNTSASGGTTTESSSEERVTAAGATPPSAVVLSKKRVRTRFTPEQKEKMLAFAARVGWRIHKQDEALVQQFCAEIGVRRQVLKVWMHNNKHTARKQQQEQDDQRQLQLQQQQQQQQPPQHHHQQAS